MRNLRNTISPAACVLAWIACTWLVTGPREARAEDSEGCLTCHRYPGLGRVRPGGAAAGYYHIDADYANEGLGSHARLRCTDCHPSEQMLVIPHKPVSRVNCLQECHLISPQRPPVTYSHRRVADVLRQSRHAEAALARCNELLGRPLAPGQSNCLLCHEEPVFPRARKGGSLQQAPVERCASCHDEQIVINARFDYWHVHAHSEPARNKERVVQVCATCHSNERIRAEFKLSDAAASYLASFHGKASLLGSQETAGCLDCHTRPGRSVHAILSKNDPASSTSAGQVATTCRSPACHPTAGARLTSAAIHLNLPTSRGVEFIIAAIFVALVAFTFGPSLLMTAMKLVQRIIGRSHDHDVAHAELIRRLQSDPLAARTLERFTVHQRLQHWFLAICFVTLAVTGFPMKFADAEWSRWVVMRLGGLPTARLLHRCAGVLLIAGLFYHLGYIFVAVIKKRRASGRSLISVVRELPMVVSPRDLKSMHQLLLYLLFLRRKRPEGERFNPEEKFEYLGVFWGTFVLGLTGLLMWANAWATRHMAGRLLTVASVVHTFEAFLALLHVGIVHMTSVVLSPGVFPVSPAMFTGRTPPAELAEAHSAMLNEIDPEARSRAGEAGHA